MGWLLYGVVIATLAFLVSRRFRSRGSPLKHLRGPPASWLYGNVLEIASQEKVGDLDTKWIREFGGAWRIKDCFGADILMVADPKALQHICQKSGYDYPKDKRWTQLIRLVTGNGVAAAIGDAHVRQRNAMNPAFTTAQLRQYVPVFQRAGAKLAAKWQAEVMHDGNGSRELTVSKWLPRATLDALGEAAFSYQFDTLEDDSNELARAYLSLFSNALYSGNKADFLWRAIWKFIPDNVMDLIKYVPAGDARKFAKNWDIMKDATEQLVDQKVQDGSNGRHKDLMDVMIETNSSAVGSARVPRAELVAQVTTLFVAGHESIAITTDLLLWELAKKPDCQEKIREEITTLRRNLAQRGDSEYTIEDLESMTYTVAVVKELLRLHPTGYHVHRTTAKDDIIPLSKPIRLDTGELVSEIPVEAGQNIALSLWGYNRMPDVWGEDATTFNPDRFLDGNTGRASNVGLYANIMTFSAGVRGCIGWRFAVLELLALVVELVEHFHYSLSSNRPDILPVARGPTTYPAPRGEEDRGPNLPLQVTLL
ncbi:cytochrome P450 [Obba rivulosa]|uniref:Cytochrome P450 n=1 Tax=Obba rivulosa TaxID=1052685 RepID=A0A8E2AJK1_9APHY|nr:cytochrome P450 [Obba rivulosa]